MRHKIIDKFLYIFPVSIYMVTDLLESYMFNKYIQECDDSVEIVEKMKIYYYMSFIGNFSFVPLIWHHKLIGWVPGFIA